MVPENKIKFLDAVLTNDKHPWSKYVHIKNKRAITCDGERAHIVKNLTPPPGPNGHYIIKDGEIAPYIREIKSNEHFPVFSALSAAAYKKATTKISYDVLLKYTKKDIQQLVDDITKNIKKGHTVDPQFINDVLKYAGGETVTISCSAETYPIYIEGHEFSAVLMPTKI